MTRGRSVAGVAGLAAVAGLSVGVLGSSDYPLANELWWCRVSGWVALSLLGLSLVVSPMSRVWKSASGLAPLRRALGVSAAGWGVVHASLVVSFYAHDSTLTMLWWHPFTRAGIVTLGTLLVLLATSFAPIVKGVGMRQWKLLHRLSYVAAIAAVVHVLAAPFAPVMGAGLFGLGIVAVLMLRVVLRFVPVRSA